MEPQLNQTQHTFAANTQTSQVVTLKDWMITILLMIIPVVNIILLCIWAFGGSTNPSKANYAKATLIWMAIGIVLYVVVFVLLLGSMMSELSNLSLSV